MSAVLSLPPGFEVYFNFENPILREEVSKLPFMSPILLQKDVDILLVDSLKLAEEVNYSHLVLIDTSLRTKICP
ncbi:MAG: hypothetical protein ACI9CE_000057 [Flavobacterium sp.]|jgi:hypothetical protein